MSTLILKFILCSAALYGVYHFILRREKTLKFNRFFLVSILGFSLLFPNIVTKTEYIEIPVQETTIIETGQYAPPTTTTQNVVQAEPKFTISSSEVLWIIYGLVSFFFVLRFIGNLLQLRQLKKGGLLIKKDHLYFCLRDDIKASFTFLNTIYLNKEAYEQNNIPKQIVQHEAVHANQKHSLDIIFMEAIQCVLWFNPILYLIKPAIKMNHEYLADARVCEQTLEISRYQKTLIQYVYNSKQQPVLASQLTYGQTKNRLNMMVKNLQMHSAAMRIMLTLLVTAGALWGFGEKRLIAKVQQDSRSSDTTLSTQAQLFREGIDPLIKYKNDEGNWIERKYSQLNIDLIAKLSSKNDATHIYYATPLDGRFGPSPNSFEMLKKANVWLDGQKVDPATITQDFYLDKISHFYYGDSAPWQEDYRPKTKNIALYTFKNKSAEAPTQVMWQKMPKVFIGSKFYSVSSDTIQELRIPLILKPKENQKVKFLDDGGELIEKSYSELTQDEKKRFKKPEAQGEVLVAPTEMKPLPEAIYKELTDASKYGIWVDHQRISNEDIRQYNINDFHHYHTSKLYPNATNYGKHEFQIDLTTWTAFENSPDSKERWVPYASRKIVRRQKQETATSKEQKSDANQDDFTRMRMSSPSGKKPLVRLKHGGTFYILEFQKVQDD